MASISGMRSVAAKIPRLPPLQAVSPKDSTVSLRSQRERSSRGDGCQLCPLSRAGVEWSPVTTSTSGFSATRAG